MYSIVQTTVTGNLVNTSDAKSLVGWDQEEEHPSKMYWAKPAWQLPCLARCKGKCACRTCIQTLLPEVMY